MAKLTLNDLSSLTNEQSALVLLAANNTLIENAMENTLSRDGTTPNTMDDDLDMDSHHILNLPQPATSAEPLRLSDLNSFVGGGTVTNIPAGGNTGDVLAKTTGTDYDVSWQSNTTGIVAGTNLSESGTSPVTLSTVANPTFATSTTTPQIYGGTAAGAALDIRSSSHASPTGDTTTVRGNTITLRAISGGTSTINMGVSGTTGCSLVLAGSSSGTTTVNPAAAASGTLTLPAATDTLIGKATTDTLTNKTFDTAGTGNSFSINGLAATANTGTGSVVRATSPTLVTPVLGAATATSINGQLITAGSGSLALGTGALGIASGSQITLTTGGATSTITFQGTDTYVGRATTDTLTNKTLTTPVINNASTLSVGTNGGANGTVTLNGSTSGSGIIKVAAAAGSAVALQIPSTMGSAGQYLQLTDTNGTTAWAAGGGAVTSGNLVLLNTFTGGGTSYSDSTNITSTYSRYLVTFQDIVMATDTTQLFFRLRNGGTYQSTSYLNASLVVTGGGASAFVTGTSAILLSEGSMSNNAARGYSGHIYVNNPSGTTLVKHVSGSGMYKDSSAVARMMLIGAYWDNVGAVDGFQLLSSSGNLTSGTMKIYGVVN